MPNLENSGPAVLAGTDSYRLRSDLMPENLIVDVSKPLHPVPDGAKLPVIYAVDGNSTFAMTSQIARMYQILPGFFPQVLTVGVSLDLTAADHPIALVGGVRYRNFTPSTDAAHMAHARAMPPHLAPPPGYEPGGAEATLDFLLDELHPLITDRYSVADDDRTILGVSLSGLFAVHAMLSRPGAFARCVAVSPSLWWDDKAIFAAEAASAKASAAPTGRMYLGVGSREEHEDANAKMVSNLAAFADQLAARGHPGLELKHEVIADEGHLSVPPAGIGRGLRAVFV